MAMFNLEAPCPACGTRTLWYHTISPQILTCSTCAGDVVLRSWKLGRVRVGGIRTLAEELPGIPALPAKWSIQKRAEALLDPDQDDEKEVVWWPYPWPKPRRILHNGPPKGLAFVVEGTSFYAAPTGDRGADTGRSRYVVFCTTCKERLHDNTTSVPYQVEGHLRIQHRSKEKTA